MRPTEYNIPWEVGLRSLSPFKCYISILVGSYQGLAYVIYFAGGGGNTKLGKHAYIILERSLSPTLFYILYYDKYPHAVQGCLFLTLKISSP